MRNLLPVLKAACLAVLLALPVTPAAHAGDQPGISVELNAARQNGPACTLSFVLRNGLTAPVEAMSLEVVLFNKDGLVDKFLRLKTGPLPVAKMRVKQFALKARKCDAMSRILINDVPDCRGAELSPAACLAALRVSSRSHIELTL